jgi:rRNA small subunit pseudouridine methyltransferase Nep1
LLNLVIAEAALELVPREVEKHPSVRNDAKRRELEPTQLLLDRSTHHHAMLKLAENEKRGRPDLVHLTLLSITSTPLYRKGAVRVYIHTRDDVVLDLKEGTRPPKSYARFRDLVQKLLVEKPKSGLISVHEWSLPRLIDQVNGDLVVGFSTQGKESGLEKVAREISEVKEPIVVIGGFPKGHFSPQTVSKFDEMVRIHPDPLDAHVVAARLVYEVEKLL